MIIILLFFELIRFSNSLKSKLQISEPYESSPKFERVKVGLIVFIGTYLIT
jgi:hypothetical protein